MAAGCIFDIQRFTIHDGPGIRSTVFFKGCSNRCAWCHNPESILPRPQIQYYPQRCTRCGACSEICPVKAHVLEAGQHIYNRSLCTACGSCTKVCLANALVLSGSMMTTEQVLEQVMEDRVYYRQSGGGVTLSGGEPVLQHAFAKDILLTLKNEGIHTAVQTAGFYPFESLEELLPYTDLIMYDIKAYEPALYSRYIGGDREVIFRNLERADEFGIPIIVRTPVVGTVNDQESEIEKIAQYISKLHNFQHYTLIPYHGLGKAKHDALGRQYPETFYTPSSDDIRKYEILASKYVPVYNHEQGFIKHI